jgi:serine/threonine-protein phosphatase 5
MIQLTVDLTSLSSQVRFSKVSPLEASPTDILSPFAVDVSKKLLEAFSKGKLLHEDYATRIFSSMRRLMKKLATVNEISIPAGGRVVVVGDTHGQLTDLITIFRIAGFPSKTNVFLFNGDFVDRGPQDVEIILTLYSLKLAGPDTIFFNRGNHEQRHMNEKYNFENNVRARYDPVIFELVQKTFKYLPLASVIQSKVYVTHGGLFPFEDVTLDEIKGYALFFQVRAVAADLTSSLQT